MTICQRCYRTSNEASTCPVPVPHCPHRELTVADVLAYNGVPHGFVAQFDALLRGEVKRLQSENAALRAELDALTPKTPDLTEGRWDTLTWPELLERWGFTFTQDLMGTGTDAWYLIRKIAMKAQKDRMIDTVVMTTPDGVAEVVEIEDDGDGVYTIWMVVDGEEVPFEIDDTLDPKPVFRLKLD